MNGPALKTSHRTARVFAALVLALAALAASDAAMAACVPGTTVHGKCTQEPPPPPPPPPHG